MKATDKTREHFSEMFEISAEYVKPEHTPSITTLANKPDMLKFNVTLTRKDNGVRMTLDYHQGIGHLPNYSQSDRSMSYFKALQRTIKTGQIWRAGREYMSSGRIPAPKIEDVLACLLLDAEVLDHESFESWASDFGYDTDSRKAYATWKNCLNQSLKFKRLCGGETEMNTMQEAWAEY